MSGHQHYGAAHVVAHSQAEDGSLHFITEFNECECREYEYHRDRILEMLDDAENLLRASRKPELTDNSD